MQEAAESGAASSPAKVSIVQHIELAKQTALAGSPESPAQRP